MVAAVAIVNSVSDSQVGGPGSSLWFRHFLLLKSCDRTLVTFYKEKFYPYVTSH